MATHQKQLNHGDRVRFHDGDRWTDGTVEGSTGWGRFVIEAEDGLLYTRDYEQLKILEVTIDLDTPRREPAG